MPVIGELDVLILGDYSTLDDAISESVIAAEAGGRKISEAMDRGAQSAGDLGASMGDLTGTTRTLKMTADEFSSTLDKLIDERFGATTAEESAKAQQMNAQAMQRSAAAAKSLDEYLDANNFKSFTEQSERSQDAMKRWSEQASAAMKTSADATKAASAELNGMNVNAGNLLNTLVGFAGISLTFAGLEKAIVGSINAFDRVDDATAAITALTGSAQKATANIDQMRQLAQSNALSFPELLKADQNMIAFGFDTGRIPGLLQAAADAAAVTGKSFDATAQVLERVAAAGQLGGRQLVGLGLTLDDVSKVMGVTRDKASEMFKALDESARIDVLTAALGKFRGLAKQTTDDIGGDWQRLKNTVTAEMEQIGKALNTTGRDLLSDGTEIIHTLGSMAQSVVGLGQQFLALPSIVKESFAAIAVAVAANPMAALGLEIVRAGLAWQEYDLAAQDAAKATETADKRLGMLIVTERQMLVDFPQFTARLNELVKGLNDGSISETEFEQKVRALNTEFRNLHPVVQQVAQAHKNFAEAVADLKAKLDAHTITQAQYDQGVRNLVASFGHLKPSVDSAKTAVSDFQKELDKIGSSVQKAYDAAAVYRDVVAQFGKNSLEGQVAARLLESALKAVGATSITDLQPALANTAKAITVLTGHMHDNEDTVHKLRDAHKTLADQLSDGQKVIYSYGSAIRDMNSILTDNGIKTEDVTNRSQALNDELIAMFPTTTKVADSTTQMATAFTLAGTAATRLSADVSPLEARLDALDSGIQRVTKSARGMSEVLAGGANGSSLLAGTLGSGISGGLTGGGRGGGSPLFNPENPDAGGVIMQNSGRTLGLATQTFSFDQRTYGNIAPQAPQAPIGGVMGGIDYGQMASGLKTQSAITDTITSLSDLADTAGTYAAPAADQLTDAVTGVAARFTAAAITITSAAAQVAAAANVPPPEFAAQAMALGGSAVPSLGPVASPGGMAGWSAQKLTLGPPPQSRYGASVQGGAQQSAVERQLYTPKGTVNIYNPTVTNTTDLDKMIKQIQDAGGMI